MAGAIREVWYQSHARKLAVKKCTGPDGFPRCPKCGLKVPKVQIDHITPVGPIESEGAILRMFCPSVGLRGLCPDCHTIVTNIQSNTNGVRTRKKKTFLDTF